MSNQVTNLDPSFIELYKLYRDWIHAEEGLINNRVTLLLTTQGFLLALIGVLLNSRIASNTIYPPVVAICITTLAMFLTHYAYISIKAARDHINHIEMLHEEEKKKCLKDAARLPDITGKSYTKYKGGLFVESLKKLSWSLWGLIGSAFWIKLLYMIQMAVQSSK